MICSRVQLALRRRQVLGAMPAAANASSHEAKKRYAALGKRRFRQLDRAQVQGFSFSSQPADSIDHRTSTPAPMSANAIRVDTGGSQGRLPPPKQAQAVPVKSAILFQHGCVIEGRNHTRADPIRRPGSTRSGGRVWAQC